MEAQVGRGEDAAAFEDEFVELAVEEQAPVRLGAVVGGGLLAEAGGAVGGDEVVEAGLLAELVLGVDAIEKEAFSLIVGAADAVEVDGFAAEIGAEADEVFFAAEEVLDFEAFVEAGERGEGFVGFAAGFDGEDDPAIGAEVEASEGVGDEGAPEGGEEEVGAAEVGEVDGAGFPARGHATVELVVEVAELVEGDAVAIDFVPAGLGEFRLPVAMVRWLEGGVG